MNDMPTHIFLSDLHLDKLLISHTTRESRLALRELKYDAVMSSIADLKIIAPNALIVDCGDILDSHLLPDNSAMQMCVNYFDVIDIMVAGNHDSISRNDNVTCLDILSHIYPEKVVQNRSLISSYTKQVRSLTLIPHHATQEAYSNALYSVPDVRNDTVCVTHANILLPDLLCNETTLNLNEKAIEHLSYTYGLTVIGHNHAPASYGDADNVISCGTTFPGNFTDATHDCSILLYNSETNKTWRYVTYETKKHYSEIGFDTPITKITTFMKMIGDWNYEHAVTTRNELLAAGALAVKLPEILTEDELLPNLEGSDTLDFSVIFKKQLNKLQLTKFINYIKRIIK